MCAFEGGVGAFETGVAGGLSFFGVCGGVGGLGCGCAWGVVGDEGWVICRVFDGVEACHWDGRRLVVGGVYWAL